MFFTFWQYIIRNKDSLRIYNMQEINLLSKEEAATELESIATEMAKADIAYYQNDNPYLTDAEYDALKKGIRK